MRTTIRFEPARSGVMFRIDEPKDVPDANILDVLDCNVNQTPFLDLAAQGQADAAQGSLVREAGLAVYDRLAVSPGVKAALERISHAAPDEASPIYLQMTTSAAEVLPFETLFLPNHQFLALDDRTPIARVAMARFKGGVIDRLCEVPLKVTAVISATGRSVYEEKEWDSLYQAFQHSPLDFQLQVLVGRDGLRDLIEQAQDHRVKVQRIEGNEEDLVRIIGEFEPIILHFFCHGTTKPVPYLMVGSRASHDLSDDPLYLGDDHIRRLSRTLMLVILNACEGAKPLPNAYSLALAMVENAGVPVVVGMREAIDAEDANLFTGAFYQELLKELNRVLSDPQGDVPNWPLMLRVPRERLARRGGGPPVIAAAAHKRWSLPVLYLRPEELRLRRAGTMHQLGALQALRAHREMARKDTPPEVLATIDASIAALEKEMSP